MDPCPSHPKARRLSALALAFVILGCPGTWARASDAAPDDPSKPSAAGQTIGTNQVVFVLRQAEKSAEPKEDPGLTEQGLARARDLARILEPSGVSGLYVTDTRRSKETLGPLTLPVTLYGIDDPNGVARAVLASGCEVSVVVAHGDTVVPIVEGLGAVRHRDFGPILYDDLFVVSVPSSGPARVLRLKYGPTPP